MTEGVEVTEQIEEDTYPSIGYNVTTNIGQSNRGPWNYTVRLHIVGPDDVFSYVSKDFKTKKECCEGLVRRFTKTIDELLAEF